LEYHPGKGWDEINQCYPSDIENDYLDDEEDIYGDDDDDFDAVNYHNKFQYQNDDDDEFEDYGVEPEYINNKNAQVEVKTNKNDNKEFTNKVQRPQTSKVQRRVFNETKLPENEANPIPNQEKAPQKKNKLDDLFGSTTSNLKQNAKPAKK
jgi:hypothetical protein